MSLLRQVLWGFSRLFWAYSRRYHSCCKGQMPLLANTKYNLNPVWAGSGHGSATDHYQWHRVENAGAERHCRDLATASRRRYRLPDRQPDCCRMYSGDSRRCRTGFASIRRLRRFNPMQAGIGLRDA